MRQPLPRVLRRSLQATPQWLPISLPPQGPIADVTLRTAEGDFDVTGNDAVAALRPLTIRLGLDARLQDAVERSPRSSLHLVDVEHRRDIGVLHLKHVRNWSTDHTLMGLFEVTGGTHYCAHRLRRAWDSWMYQRAARRASSHNQLMPAAAVEQLMVFYLCPRPVFLVSVDDGWHSNIFPMDLVGPLGRKQFTLALRNTSASVQTIKNARRVALSDVPGNACPIAYKLGAHHTLQTIDWGALPFQVTRSQEYALPAPDLAPRIREIEILDFQAIGSHTLFIGRITSDRTFSGEPRLFHTSVIHQRLRLRQKRSFLEAPTDAAVPDA